MKTIKMPLLWTIFTAVAFFSCGDAVDPSIGVNVEISDLTFGTIGWSNFPRECNIGDPITLGCCVSIPQNSVKKVKAITAKITTLYGNVGRVILTPYSIMSNSEHPINGVWYKNFLFAIDIIPVVRYNGWEYTYGMPAISPNGDILTAEIIYKNKTIKTTINIRSK